MFENRRCLGKRPAIKRAVMSANAALSLTPIARAAILEPGQRAVIRPVDVRPFESGEMRFGIQPFAPLTIEHVGDQ